MKKKESYDVNAMYEQACAFRDCACYMETESKKIPRKKEHFYVSISLSALTCEIFLKCLIKINSGDYGKEHNLSKLWDILKEKDLDTTTEIERDLMKWLKVSVDTTFSDMMNNASNAFSEWRYCYEYSFGRECTQFLRGLRKDLEVSCCRKMEEIEARNFDAPKVESDQQ